MTAATWERQSPDWRAAKLNVQIKGVRSILCRQMDLTPLIWPAKFDLLGKVRISESETWAHLAVSGDELFIRELDAIAAYRWAPSKK
jgi:hypothetical protein